MPATLFGQSTKIRVLIFGFLLTVFAGCYKNHLYVQQEWVDRNFLASTRVGTPDPRQESPPEGQRLLVSWRFPKYLLDNGLKLVLTVRFWDHTEEKVEQPMNSTRGYAAFNFFKQKILTYRIQVVDHRGNIIETWEHHFWTELIDIDRRRASVSSQPRQGSVIETP